ncbi:hypothetical protein NPIL_639291 [Nephila pilipes]|uniref:Uncharacterized protein n=1 Tax=Nephila pilipes TaxID=299642 RepID=A0A8X6T611_NEPPI|nr:hypothetical protein NPIL_639291 [Nephila pilipes]
MVGNKKAQEGRYFNSHKIVPKGYLVLSKLKEHLECNHSELVHKGKEIFKRRPLPLPAESSKIMWISKNGNKNATEVSFAVSLLNANSGTPHTIAETLIKPCKKNIISYVLGLNMAK